MTLRLRDITLTYPDGDRRLTALDDVTLDVPAGTITAVIGPSGSGKSSLLAVAATLITPDRGTVVVDGIDNTGMSRGDTSRLRLERIGIVFQQSNLISSLTALEQLEVMARLDGRPARPARERAIELLETMGLADRAHRRPHQLSGGQRQRINIARGLMNDPAVLLVDEPTSSLDRERGAEIIDLIADLTVQRSTATVLVTHDRRQLERADDVIELVDGRVTESTAAA